MDSRIPPMRCGGPCVLDRLLHVMGDVRRLLHNRMVGLSVMARREQETSFQTFNGGLVFDRAAGSSTIRVYDRIHDRMAPPGQTSNTHSDWYDFLNSVTKTTVRETFWNSGIDRSARFLKENSQFPLPVVEIFEIG